MKEEKSELKFLMEKLKSEMAKLEELRRTEADGRKLGIISQNQLQMQLFDMRQSFKESMRTSESNEDPVTLKIALQKAKEAHSFLLTKLTQMETDYVDVVPKKQFDEAAKKLETMNEDMDELNKRCKTLQSSLENQHKVLEETIEQKNVVEELYNELKQSSTPRPAWRETVCGVPGGKRYWKALVNVKSSKERLHVLMREMLTDGEGAERRSSRGTDSTVPALLRSSEPVLQRRLPLRDLLLLVEDIWSKRKTQLTEFLDKYALAEESERPSLLSFDEFLANYFQVNFGLPALRKEWAYALYNSTTYYSECEELVQLRKIIDNQNHDIQGPRLKVAGILVRSSFIVVQRAAMRMRMNILSKLRAYPGRMQMDEAYHWYLDSLIRRAFNKLKQLAHATAIASTVPDDEKAQAHRDSLSKCKASRHLAILTPDNLQTCLSRLLQCDAKQASVMELVRCAFADQQIVSEEEEGTDETVVIIPPDATVAVENLFEKKSGQPQSDFVNLLVVQLEMERKATINHILMELQRYKRTAADANNVELAELLEALKSVRPEFEKLLAFSSTQPLSPGGSTASEKRPDGEFRCELDETGATMQEQALALAWCNSSEPKNYLMATLKWVLQEQYVREIQDPLDKLRLPIEVVNKRLVGANIKARDLLTVTQQPDD